ncbi:MAG: hypothetical protein CMF48_02110 [Legionellales bacterium]|nr:hypothetical protein [Legionellales bacterium]|tara:strand:+ start:1016 stop:1264 length:249 start_codon:yes stop_codon:yes gene_type:complete
MPTPRTAAVVATLVNCATTYLAHYSFTRTNRQIAQLSQKVDELQAQKKAMEYTKIEARKSAEALFPDLSVSRPAGWNVRSKP